MGKFETLSRINNHGRNEKKAEFCDNRELINLLLEKINTEKKDEACGILSIVDYLLAEQKGLQLATLYAECDASEKTILLTAAMFSGYIHALQEGRYEWAALFIGQIAAVNNADISTARIKKTGLFESGSEFNELVSRFAKTVANANDKGEGFCEALEKIREYGRGGKLSSVKGVSGLSDTKTTIRRKRKRNVK